MMIMIDNFARDLATLDASGQTFVLGFMTGLQYGNTRDRDREHDKDTSAAAEDNRDNPLPEPAAKA